MQICCAGEVMVELAREDQSGLYHEGIAGDSFNTAVYLARAGFSVDYLTRLGDDVFSAKILMALEIEGIGQELIQQCAGRQPGLYLISNNKSGERQFTYWRHHSPAREMFDQPVSLAGYNVFYFTGITVAIARTGLDNLISLLQQLRQQDCTIVFDPNYRPPLWQNLEQAQRCYRQVLPFCDILMPTLEDETALWGVETVQECRALHKPLGLQELVIKGHELVSHVFCAGRHVERQAPLCSALDTTGAGDSFNAGYLAARLQDRSVEEAVESAQQLAASVVQHRGAILPHSSTGLHGKP